MYVILLSYSKAHFVFHAMVKIYLIHNHKVIFHNFEKFGCSLKSFGFICIEVVVTRGVELNKRGSKQITSQAVSFAYANEASN